MRIQHNIAALNSYRNLTNNNSAVSKNLEKLSSGYRINRAGDDAAGLAISEKMRAQITGLETAQKNANDGISLIQTAEGALTEVHSMLNRMVELANQSANGTYQDEDRANLQAEVSALTDEIDRISKGTNFNGINLLDGSLGNKASVSGMKDVTLTSVADGQMGKTPTAGKMSFDIGQLSINSDGNGDGDLTFTVAGQQFKDASGTAIDFTGKLKNDGSLSGKEIAAMVDGSTITIDGSTYDVTTEIMGDSAKVILTGQDAPTQEPAAAYNVVLTATNSTTTVPAGNGNHGDQIAMTVHEQPISAQAARLYAKAEFDLKDIVKDGAALKIGDTTYVFAVGKDSAFKNAANVVDLTDMTADDVNLVITAGDRLSKVAANNKNFLIGTDRNKADTKIRITEREGGVDYNKNNLAGADGSGNTMDASATNWKGLVQTGKATMTGAGLTLQIGDTSDDFNKLAVSVDSMNSKSLGLGDIDISTQAGANAAVDKIKAAINTVSTQRGNLGALQNRLEHTINNLSVTAENMTAAESRIRDVDMAKEMMAYTKNNILVQASQAMLAQANQIPQGVLQLLQ